VVSCATTRPFTDPRKELAAALTSPVRWRETMLTLDESGCTRYVEVGPGKVLARLGKRILTDGPKVETPSLEPANA
jgi:malonyl CoA-acyl carrier protein transacylase